MKGVLLIAIGNSYTSGLGECYGRWANNMAMSLKRFMPEVPIQILFDRESSRKLDRKYFDHFTDITGICTETISGQFEPAEVKLQLNQYSVFDQTIYIDVDGVCLQNFEHLFDKLDKMNFVSQTTGYLTKDNGQKTMLWCLTDFLWNKYNLDPSSIMPATNTSFIYFNKSEAANKIFNTAFDIYRFDPVPIDQLASKWGQSHSQPDELYFNISLTKNQADIAVWENPIFFRHARSNNAYLLKDVRKMFYLLGCYGGKKYNHESIERYYDILMKEVYQHFRTPFLYTFNKLIKNKFFQIVKPRT